MNPKPATHARTAPVKNPRLLFAERIDAVWTDLGASEVRETERQRQTDRQTEQRDGTETERLILKLLNWLSRKAS